MRIRAAVVLTFILALQLSLPGSASADPGTPPHQTEVQPPRPFDPARDVLYPDSTPQLNLVGRRPNLPDLAADRARTAARRKAAGDPLPGTGDVGYKISVASFGAYAIHDVRRDVYLPAGWGTVFIYAPTLAAVDGYSTNRIGCLESVTIHRRFQGQVDVTHEQGFWDHCIRQGWAKLQDMNDATFRNKYVRVMYGRERYTTLVYKDVGSGVTYGLLWDYTLNLGSGGWSMQTSVQSTNTPLQNGGWTMWESHGLSEQQLCPVTINPIQAFNVQILLDSGAWVDLTPARSQPYGPFGYCFDTRQYVFVTNFANHDWEVR